MRPAILYKLFSKVENISGVGKAKASAYGRLNCLAVKDLLYHLPTSINDRTWMPALDSHINSGAIITIIIKVCEHIPARKRGSAYRILCSNPSGQIEIVYFNAKPEMLKKIYPLGAELAISGKVEKTPHLQMIHPDIILAAKNINHVKIIEPVYPLTYALTNRQLRKSIDEALKIAPTLSEWLQEDFLKKQGWLSWHESLKKIHHPQHAADISLHSAFRKRLAFDEILAHQLNLYAARYQIKKQLKEVVASNGDIIHKLLDLLPFNLTEAQEEAIAVIKRDQQQPERMLRLLQGDVGSGKTIVAFIAILNAIAGGKQAALVAPTDLLARQHYQNLQNYCQKLNINISLLVAKQGVKEKRQVLQELANGECNLVVGTHAIFQEAVIFKNLGLAVVDEQHRFGVEQRLALIKKGENADVLMMSATPIPRTLAMVNYGDMDITSMLGKPAQRQPVQTSLMPLQRVDEIIHSLSRIMERGEKIFWLCPLVEESEKSKLTDVNLRWQSIEQTFPGKAAIVHGKMAASTREKIMQQFADSHSEIKILVATTVIEVGVDIRDATVIVIEHAERFGLSQLHQLRGRVGRNDKKAHCILLYQTPLGEISKQRLEVMKNSNDGFYIAEQDLKLRGAGDLLGTKQSGLPEFKAFMPEVHQDLLELAHAYAQQLINEDPKLTTGANQNLRLLMHLFDHYKMIELFYS